MDIPHFKQAREVVMWLKCLCLLDRSPSSGVSRRQHDRAGWTLHGARVVWPGARDCSRHYHCRVCLSLSILVALYYCQGFSAVVRLFGEGLLACCCYCYYYGSCCCGCCCYCYHHYHCDDDDDDYDYHDCIATATTHHGAGYDLQSRSQSTFSRPPQTGSNRTTL